MQEQAPPHLAIMHYTELLDEKGLVLAKADAISPHLISVAEVSSLLSIHWPHHFNARIAMLVLAAPSILLMLHLFFVSV